MNLWRHIDEAWKKWEALEATLSDTPDQVAAKVGVYAEAEESGAKLKAAVDDSGSDGAQPEKQDYEQ